MSFARNLKRLVRRVVDAVFADVHTHIPCRVVKYTEATNLVSIQPCIKRFRTEDPDNLDTVQLPIIEDVPVQQLGSGLVVLTCPPIVDSYGIFHVNEREINTWITQGGIVDPASSRKFDISDGFFVPGLWPIVDPIVSINTDRMELRTRVGTSYVAVTDTGAVEITSMGIGLVTLDITGDITVENSAGSMTLDAAGQVDINGNFTVDP